MKFRKQTSQHSQPFFLTVTSLSHLIWQQMLGKFKIKGTDQTSQPSLGTCSHPINQYQDCKGLKIKKIKKLTKYKRVPMIIEREKQDRYNFFFFDK